ncbi:dTMP kinase [bacterium]|nr:dTMP kinase [bacterium]
MDRGLFITVEGLDGSGKTTQIAKLKGYLEDNGHIVYLTREPGGTPLAERIRDIILDKSSGNVLPLTEFFLYLACRYQHTYEVIKPKLEQNVFVISDRYADSSVAYQGGGRELTRNLVMTFNKVATGGLEPDLTFFIDLTPEEAIKRIEKTGKTKDRLEDQSISFHQRVREGYIELCELFPDRIKRIDGEGSAEEVWEAIRKEYSIFWSNKGVNDHEK